MAVANAKISPRLWGQHFEPEEMCSGLKTSNKKRHRFRGFFGGCASEKSWNKTGLSTIKKIEMMMGLAKRSFFSPRQTKTKISDEKKPVHQLEGP